MYKRNVLLLMTCAVTVTDAIAYGTPTHVALTTFAIERSSITADPRSSPLLDQLGLVNALARDYGNPFATRLNGDFILPLSPNALWMAAGANFEREVASDVGRSLDKRVAPASLPGWIIRGAIREDDNAKENPLSDEPGGVFTRVYGHFFDPEKNRGLTIGTKFGSTASEWALDPTARAMANGSLSRDNKYNIPYAREAMWRALTGLSREGGTAAPTGTTPTGYPGDVRNAYWAVTFRILGDAAHLLQDMTQPQHTRNDPHSGLGCVSFAGCLGGHDTFYEKYIQARTLGDTSFQLEETFLGSTGKGPVVSFKARPLNYGQTAATAYPKPVFDKYSDFFATGTGRVDNAVGRGLANYSNRGFYTVGTNISRLLPSSYSSPDPTGQSLARALVFGTGLSDSPLKDMVGKPITGWMSFAVGQVQDNMTGVATPNVRLSTFSAWDQFTQTTTFLPSYSLNYYNYDAMADLLLPRAVAYSAGFIDYFFRGAMAINLPDEGIFGLIDHSDPAANCKSDCGFKRIVANVSNSTPGTEAMSAGKLVAVLKFRRNNCYKSNLEGYPPLADPVGCRTADEEIVVSNRVNSGADVAIPRVPTRFQFDFPTPLPINATDVRLQVVYRGVLGSEADAVVVATQDIAEPTFFSYLNATDYIKIGNSVYTRADVDGTPDLLDKVVPQSLVDRSVSPPKLAFASFRPKSVDSEFWFDSQGKARVVSRGLPTGAFYRLAILAKAPARGQPESTAPTPIRLVQGTCVGSDSAIQPMVWQTNYMPETYTFQEKSPTLSPSRGALQWEQTVCLHFGDGSDISTLPPDWSAHMLASGPLDPVAVEINGGAGF